MAAEERRAPAVHLWRKLKKSHKNTMENLKSKFPELQKKKNKEIQERVKELGEQQKPRKQHKQQKPFKKGGLVKKSIDGIARKGKTKGKHR